MELNDNDWNSPTTKLLTLLNVSSAKSLKRKFGQQGSPPHRLNKRRAPDRDSSNSVAEVNADAEIIEREAGEAGRANSLDDVRTGEAADLSDAEGVIHLWSRKSCLTIK